MNKNLPKQGLLILLMSCMGSLTLTAQNIDTLTGPIGSESFGGQITVLSNGNYVVVDPYYDEGGVANIGAVYLYKGSDNALISTLKGSYTNDRVGNGGVTALSNGNYLVASSIWNGNRGAVTWGNGNSGISGTISSSNSLVGSIANDRAGSGGVTLLSNGNYVVASFAWNGRRGAVTWGNGNSGISGTISSSNSLLGSIAFDQVGNGGVTALSNGNYVVASFAWNGTRGAVTWGNGNSGISGTISSSNSLLGSIANDQVGNVGVFALSNGNYVVASAAWNGNRGAVTWGNGSSGISGTISSSNSLLGSIANDQVGKGGVFVLSNGNYVVASAEWNGRRGAVTWGNGSSGISGTISSSNSLLGSISNDGVGIGGVSVLNNGNYVVASSAWNGTRGAVTWGNGSSGISGTISSSNSLVGSIANDYVGSFGVTPLSNGNYVVASFTWNRNRGAVTWGSGSSGVTGTVSSSNSLVGSAANDYVGVSGVFVLNNGNYVVTSAAWNGNRGAVTWGNGNSGITGAISSSNSLVGSIANDKVGNGRVTALNNGNYVVASSVWNRNRGAVTWGNGSTGITGTVSSSNSLVGSTTNDRVGGNGVNALSNGNYVLGSPRWNGARGAVSVSCSGASIIGIISSTNSLLGNTPNTSWYGFPTVENSIYGNLIIGHHRENLVYIYSCSNNTAPEIVLSGHKVNIMDSTLAVSFTDSTNFGASKMGSTVSYQINNTGDDTLRLTMPLVNIKGKHAADFMISVMPDSSIAPGDSSSFTISFLSTKIGTKTAWVEIISNDMDEDTFTFNIQAEQQLDCNYGSGFANSLGTMYTGAFTEMQPDGYNCYCDSTGSLLLALNLAGTGAVIQPNEVQLQIGTERGFTSMQSGGMITNPDGYAMFNRRWDVQPTTQPSSNVKVRYFFTQEDVDSLTQRLANLPDPSNISGYGDINIYKAATGTTPFADPHLSSGTVLYPSNYASTTTWTDTVLGGGMFAAQFMVSSFSGGGGGFGGGMGALPVEWLNFTAQKLSQNEVILNWSTATEINNSHFEIERSYDDVNFQYIARTEGAGNSQTLQSYFLQDAAFDQSQTVIYYRLKQVDFNGSLLYSNVRKVNLKGTTATQGIAVAPNPSNGNIQLAWTNGNQTEMIVRVYDLQGKQVYKQTLIANEGYQVKQLDLSHLNQECIL